MAEERVVLAFGGGKGGVGKSLVCSAVATALAQRGRSVVVLDADLGAANLHTLLGVIHPSVTLDDFWSGRASSLDELCLPTSVDGLQLISGAATALRSANPMRQDRERLLRAFLRLSADVLMFDLGAGTHESTLDLFNLAGEGLIVTGTEPTAIQNAYAFIKSALFRALECSFPGEPEAKALVDRAVLARGTHRLESVDRLLSELHRLSPDLAAVAQGRLTSTRLRLIVNQAGPKDAARVVGAVSAVCRQYLGLEVPLLGVLPPDPRVTRAIHRMSPVLVEAPTSPFSLGVAGLVDRLLKDLRLTNVEVALADISAWERVSAARLSSEPHTMSEALRAAGVGAPRPDTAAPSVALPTVTSGEPEVSPSPSPESSPTSEGPRAPERDAPEQVSVALEDAAAGPMLVDGDALAFEWEPSSIRPAPPLSAHDLESDESWPRSAVSGAAERGFASLPTERPLRQGRPSAPPSAVLLAAPTGGAEPAAVTATGEIRSSLPALEPDTIRMTGPQAERLFEAESVAGRRETGSFASEPGQSSFNGGGEWTGWAALADELDLPHERPAKRPALPAAASGLPLRAAQVGMGILPGLAEALESERVAPQGPARESGAWEGDLDPWDSGTS